MALPKIAAMLLAVGIVVGLAAGIGVSAVVPTHSPTVHPEYNKLAMQQMMMTQGVFTAIPKTADEAMAQGFVPLAAPGQEPECVPQMGMHYGKIKDGQPVQPFLLVNTAGEVIGVELESVTPQESPPWEHLPEGHPGMEFEHWTLHVYTQNPANACS